MLQSLKPRVETVAGILAPNGTAMASLFDNEYFNCPYKASVEEDIINVCTVALQNQRHVLLIKQLMRTSSVHHVALPRIFPEITNTS